MSPVERYFPAAVPEDLYWRVHRRLATTAPRGRSAGHAPKSIVAGLTHCATCGHAATRVSKGDYVYLVCSRANMRADGCKYLAVPYSLVEDALRTNAKDLVAHAPRGKSTAALEKQITAVSLVELQERGGLNTPHKPLKEKPKVKKAKRNKSQKTASK